MTGQGGAPDFAPGEQVTVLGYAPGDPYILTFQYYATVAEVVDPPVAAPENDLHWYVVELRDTHPPRERFGPFPPSRLACGWRDEDGRWRIKDEAGRRRIK